MMRGLHKGWASKGLSIALSVAVIDCVYLSWRYLNLRLGTVEVSTGLCSLTDFVDCDKVLLTPQANAFWVPNALLGLGFFGGLWLWWFIGRRLLPERDRALLLAVLLGWLSLGTLFTFYFFFLLVQLPALCPFCPWNHAFTYVALVSVWGLWRGERGQGMGRLERPSGRAWAMIAACILWFVVIQVIWIVGLRPLHVR